MYDLGIDSFLAILSNFETCIKQRGFISVLSSYLWYNKQTIIGWCDFWHAKCNSILKSNVYFEEFFKKNVICLWMRIFLDSKNMKSYGINMNDLSILGHKFGNRLETKEVFANKKSLFYRNTGRKRAKIASQFVIYFEVKGESKYAAVLMLLISQRAIFYFWWLFWENVYGQIFLPCYFSRRQ